jgi:hypothetical protein
LRFAGKKVGNRWIPECFKELKLTLPDLGEDPEDYDTFYKVIKNPRKVTIENIAGTEEHLNIIREIAATA